MLIENGIKRFDEIYKIYEESFPEVERRTKEGQREAMGRSCYRLHVMEEHGEILAFAGCWELPSCVFLEHLATSEACRGKGYGKLLVQECIDNTNKPVFLEIEPITEQDIMTARRAGFYERLGFYVNRFPYEQVPLKAGDSPIPLWIMSYGAPVEEEVFRPYKKEIYRIVYRALEREGTGDVSDIDR